MIRVRLLVATLLFLVCALPGFAEKKECSNVPARDIIINAAGHRFVPGETFWAQVYLEKHESVRWEVRGGTIVLQTTDWIQIVSGPPGVVEIDAYIAKNPSCERKISNSVAVDCQDDPTIGLFFDKGSARVGETVKAWVNLREGHRAVGDHKRHACDGRRRLDRDRRRRHRGTSDHRSVRERRVLHDASPRVHLHVPLMFRERRRPRRLISRRLACSRRRDAA